MGRYGRRRVQRRNFHYCRLQVGNQAATEIRGLRAGAQAPSPGHSGILLRNPPSPSTQLVSRRVGSSGFKGALACSR